MDAKKLIELRKLAEQAVANMPDGDMKVKAFEVMLGHLLAGSGATISVAPGTVKKTHSKQRESDAPAKTSSGRILVLKEEEFFQSPKAIGEIQEELKAHGWHYAVTALSGPLQTLVQKRRLRRQKVKQGSKEMYKYTNP